MAGGASPGVLTPNNFDLTTASKHFLEGLKLADESNARQAKKDALAKANKDKETKQAKDTADKEQKQLRDELLPHNTHYAALNQSIYGSLQSIQGKAMDIYKKDGIDAALAYARKQTGNTAAIKAVTDPIYDANEKALSAIGNERKNINIQRLRQDVQQRVSDMFMNPDGSLKDISTISPEDMKRDYIKELMAKNDYSLSSQPFEDYVAKSETSGLDGITGKRTGRGGGYTLKGKLDRWSVDNPYDIKTGRFDNNTPFDIVGEDVTLPANDNNGNKARTVRVAPTWVMSDIKSNPDVASGFNNIYSSVYNNPNSELYTDKDSPYYNTSPNEGHKNDINDYDDAGKRWFARDYIKKHSSSSVGVSVSDNRQPINIRNYIGANNPNTYVDNYTRLFNTVKDDGHGFPMNSLDTDMQGYVIGEVNKAGAKNTIKTKSGDIKDIPYTPNDITVYKEPSGRMAVAVAEKQWQKNGKVAKEGEDGAKEVDVIGERIGYLDKNGFNVLSNTGAKPKQAAQFEKQPTAQKNKKDDFSQYERRH